MIANDESVWAIVELMGHVKLAGRLTEEEKFGTKMGRLDIPAAPLHPVAECLLCSGTGECNGTPCPMDRCGPHYVSQFFGGGSVYRITIVTEAVARHVGKQTTSAPVSPSDFPTQLAAASIHDNDRDPEDDGENSDF